MTKAHICIFLKRLRYSRKLYAVLAGVATPRRATVVQAVSAAPRCRRRRCGVAPSTPSPLASRGTIEPPVVVAALLLACSGWREPDLVAWHCAGPSDAGCLCFSASRGVSLTADESFGWPPHRPRAHPCTCSRPPSSARAHRACGRAAPRSAGSRVAASWSCGAQNAISPDLKSKLPVAEAGISSFGTFCRRLRRASAD